jgi:hypothetical protein
VGHTPDIPIAIDVRLKATRSRPLARPEDRSAQARKRSFERVPLRSVRRRRELAQLLLQPIEIDRLGEELESAKFAGAALALVVAIGGHHHDRQVRPLPLDLAQKFEPIHARHVDVREQYDQLRLYLPGKLVEGLFCRAREAHHIDAVARLAAKPLAEEIGDIGFVVDNQDADRDANAQVLRPSDDAAGEW